MKRNKKGFTLAEILITLGIVGIIAALTIPAISSLKERTYEPAANRAKNLLQQSFAKVIDIANSNNIDANAITTLGAINLRDIRLNTVANPVANRMLVTNGGFNLFNDCAHEMEIQPLTAAERQNYLNEAHLMDGNDRVLLTAVYPRVRNCQIYKINKQKAYIIVEPFLQIGNGANMNFNREHDIITRVFIDVDGQESRNRLDPDRRNGANRNMPREDLYVFGLGNDGFLYNPNTAECQNFNGGCRL